MIPLEIRPGTDEDGTALRALIEPIFEEYDGVVFVAHEMPELRAVATHFREAGGELWCALREDVVVGCVGYTRASEGGGIELKRLYVAKSERSAGLGATLYDLVERAAQDRAAQFIDLWSDVRFEAAHRFYERRGYHRGARTRELQDASNSVEYYFRKVL